MCATRRSEIPMGALRIEVLRSLQAVAPLRDQIDALNLVSRRPCPFSTFEYLETFLAHDEYFAREDELLFLAAFEGSRLAAYLPLRKFPDRQLVVPFGHVMPMISHDTDRPHAVARAEDETRCCDAFYRHLLERERGWDFLELSLQDEASGLSTPPPVNPLRFFVRRSETMPNTTVPLAFPSLAAYLRGLSASQRRENTRNSRKLFATGDVELISCGDERARRPLLDLYLDLERRSWKEGAHAGIRRHPRRVEFFDALCDAGQPLAIEFDLLLLDGVAVCGHVSGRFNGGLHALETSFDDAFRDLGPGHLMNLLYIRRALLRGDRGINFDGNYAYHKARMGGVVTPTAAVQIYRAFSLPWLKAMAGKVKHRIRPPPVAPEWNPERRAAQGAAPGKQRPDRSPERTLTARILGELEARGVNLERLGGAALEASLPFAREREAA